jgi:phage terminase large subunit GpA-like protein
MCLAPGRATIDKGQISGDGRRSRIASFWMEGPAAAYQTWAQLIKFLTAEQEYETTRSEET